MGSFLANIQVFVRDQDCAQIIEELEIAVRERLLSAEYEVTDDITLADRSLVLQISSDRWISIYDQTFDEQDVHEMDVLGTAISLREGILAVGSIVHDSDLLMMRLYRNGRTSDTIINDIELFNEMSEGSRPRKRNGQPSKWADVCAPDVNPSELKAIWEEDNVFAEDALALAAKLMDIPVDAVLRGYAVDHEINQEARPQHTKILHFRSKIRISDYFKKIDVPKLEVSGDLFGRGDVGTPSKFSYSMINRGAAFTGLDVLLWGQVFNERLIEPGLGILSCKSIQTNRRAEWKCEPQPYEFELIQAEQQTEVKGFRYEYPETVFPEGLVQVKYQKWVPNGDSSVNGRKNSF